MAAITSTRTKTIQKMQMMATRPGFVSKSCFPHSCERPELVVFTEVVAVTFGESDAGGSVDLWETVSLDVWLVVVV